MSRHLLLPALLVAACSHASKKSAPAMTGRPGGPAVGVVVALHEVRDAYDTKRLGFVETRRYSNGQVLHWVTDLHREDRLGYITSGGMATKLVWAPGNRRAEHVRLGVDTREVGVRRILGYSDDVVLRATSDRALADEVLERWKRERATGGGSEGCGGE